ncbi:isopenicillin N synthase family dioxygenase [Aspergillus vadensis CBS 113365]|uniref:2OG-Fe(II) oxygenase superfamily protein n=1 Tax=Aspergillus vadensis (strain CBS 113365 / IMI 142717 / IBT 24658) TaxID=1448311 RepID=A0A319AY10_ASPVC|nr:2OG-Fe(II) oxygenase superfamily protein [Aspergillus vadensis CBS 113365]PYH64311.1 2OG-Fe(II) oxygenase superfamily protein [Aspergillus vadensis CBS 113365]
MTAMATPAYTHVELLTLNGPEYRRVSTAPPRLPSDDEIPVIDLVGIDGDLDARTVLAGKIRAAAQNTGFFYIRNHGISEDMIAGALTQAKAFFHQPQEEKEKVSNFKLKHMDGYHAVGTTQVNKSETKDRKETFSLRYNGRNDPAAGPDTPGDRIWDDSPLWAGTAHLQNFRETTISFWQARLALARKLVRIFALALDLPEDYFDSVVTHPGADGLYIHYPGTPEADLKEDRIDVGIGSHTDIQCFTLLWQDMSGGLQVLSSSDEWLDAQPIPGTLVVNIGDFLQRLSNNRFRSTVHRVYNRQSTSRYSMPFFFGFNPETVCQVVPSCIDEQHPALFEPISCGKWHRDRLALAQGKLATA